MHKPVLQLFAILILIVSMNSCMRGTYYAPVPSIFYAVDTAEKVSFNIRPGASYLRISPINYVYICGSSWYSLLRYPLQKGYSLNLGGGIHTGNFFKKMQFQSEFGIGKGNYSVRYEPYGIEDTYAFSVNSNFTSGNYLKLAFFLKPLHRTQIGIGYQIQQQFIHIRYIFRKPFDFNGLAYKRDYSGFSRESMISLVVKNEFKKFDMDFQVGVGGQYNPLDLYFRPLISLQVGIIYSLFRKKDVQAVNKKQ